MFLELKTDDICKIHILERKFSIYTQHCMPVCECMSLVSDTHELMIDTMINSSSHGFFSGFNN